jgi:hypothetical protein
MISKVKVLMIGFLVFGFISCGGRDGAKSPYSPEVPQYDTYTVQLQVGVSATMTPSYSFDVYAGENDVFLTTLTIPAGNVGSGTKNVSANFQILKTQTEETFPVKWKLTYCSSGSAWASGAIYQYWMTVVPVSTGITVDPTTEQRVGPFKGWNIGEVKQLTFKIKKS